MTACSAQIGPIPKMWAHGACTCALPAIHVFNEHVDATGLDGRAHKCTCGTWWYDEEQLALSRRWTGATS